MTTAPVRSFMLDKEDMSVKVSYNRVNDTIDIFDLKQKELGSTANFGTIGDSSGLDISLAYGVDEFYALFYNYEHLTLNYIDSQLKNNKNDLFLKVLVYRNPTAFFETLTADVGYVRNSADDLDIKDSAQLNKMIQKVNPIPGLSIDGSVISYKNKLLVYYDAVTNKPISPFVRIGDLSDNSLYLRLLTGFHYETNIVDLYTGLKYTKINTTVSIEPHDAEPMNTHLRNAGYEPVNLDRNEKTWFLGFNYTVEFGNFILDTNYEYLTIWGRSDAIKKTDDNHIINAALSYIVNKNLLVFVGGKLMLHQFNGVIPYLYNKYTKNKYDKKYGYAKIGFVYNFDTSKLFGSATSTGYTSY
ncbi:MAG: hypothetical protein DSZ05_07010 [Sulfurospirillum sp.]|nr:MAG: hypothetical protein DSZ05_07010 [Sulfurospirillum sp.]